MKGIGPVSSAERMVISSPKTPTRNITPPPSEEQEEITRADLENAVEALHKVSMIFDRKLEFMIHEDTNRVIVKVINNETGEVIREIPPEKIVELVAKMNTYLGLLIDETV
ncbi:MAG: flagellar protein FlaG [Firmicutes bacterium]|nr:flagellar protein FlaG [Bacillota bacterium]